MSGGALMKTGTVKWFNVEQGFGFIINEAGGDDLYFHVSKGDNSIIVGQKVTFDTEANPGNGKLIAINVSIVP
jgi:CspA family cold shock protein